MGTDHNENFMKAAKYLVALAIVLLIVGIGYVATLFNKQKDASNQASNTAVVSHGAIDQHAAEQYCQDSKLLSKYIDGSQVSIVTVDYSPLFMDSGYTTDSGLNIYLLRWTGANKSTGSKVLFSCQVSGTSDSVILNNLAIDGKDVYGPTGIKGL